MDIIDFDSMYNEYTQNNNDFNICEDILNKLKIKDPVTYKHCYRVGCLACNFSMFLDYPKDFSMKIFNSAIIHDIGKIKIPDSIMNKAGGKLTPDEKKILSKHPFFGTEFILENGYEQIYYALPVIALHHESAIDGKGIFKLNSSDLLNHIFLIKTCDCFDAIRIARRPDETNKSLDETLYILNNKCFHNLTKTWIEKFNSYIKHIL